MNRPQRRMLVVFLVVAALACHVWHWRWTVATQDRLTWAIFAVGAPSEPPSALPVVPWQHAARALVAEAARGKIMAGQGSDSKSSEQPSAPRSPSTIDWGSALADIEEQDRASYYHSLRSAAATDPVVYAESVRLSKQLGVDRLTAEHDRAYLSRLAADLVRGMDDLASASPTVAELVFGVRGDPPRRFFGGVATSDTPLLSALMVPLLLLVAARFVAVGKPAPGTDTLG